MPEKVKIYKDRLLAEVLKHRWEGMCYCLSDYNCMEPSCLACHNHRDEGHEANCWLALLLDDGFMVRRPISAGRGT